MRKKDACDVNVNSGTVIFRIVSAKIILIFPKSNFYVIIPANTKQAHYVYLVRLI